MGTFKIELPNTFTVSMRNGASVTVNTADVMGVGAELFGYGVGQKIRDAASGATKAAEAEGSKGVQAEAQAMMETALAALVAGEWSTRGEGGAGTDPRVLVARSITRSAMKRALGKDSPEWAKFTGLSDKEQLEKLDANYAANESILSPAVEEELARREAKAKTAKAVAKKVEFSI